MIVRRAATVSLLASVLLVAGLLPVSRAPEALAQSPIYNGYPTYPYPYTGYAPYAGYVPSPQFNTPVSSAPITTTNPLGSTTFIPAPIVPVQAPQVVIQTGGSYCNVGDEQIYVPTGASPAAYGCNTSPASPPSSPSPSSSSPAPS